MGAMAPKARVTAPPISQFDVRRYGFIYSYLQLRGSVSDNEHMIQEPWTHGLG